MDKFTSPALGGLLPYTHPWRIFLLLYGCLCPECQWGAATSGDCICWIMSWVHMDWLGTTFRGIFWCITGFSAISSLDNFLIPIVHSLYNAMQVFCKAILCQFFFACLQKFPLVFLCHPLSAISTYLFLHLMPVWIFHKGGSFEGNLRRMASLETHSQHTITTELPLQDYRKHKKTRQLLSSTSSAILMQFNNFWFHCQIICRCRFIVSGGKVWTRQLQTFYLIVRAVHEFKQVNVTFYINIYYMNLYSFLASVIFL